jgi:chitosanase
MDAFQRLIDQGYWGLELPLVVRGTEISLTALSATPRGCYDGPQLGTRSLSLASPMLRGLDVRLVQLALSDHSMDIKADGIFGQTSAKRINEYQAQSGLPATGVADIPLIAQFCL